MSKLRNAINWLVASAKYKRVYSRKEDKNFWFKVNFITLTVPPQANGLVSEKVFKKALHAWIIYAQKYFYLKNYVWKIEAHEDNRLHVHICTDTFIHYKKLSDSWNKTLNHNGLLEAHFQKFGNRTPNSTDVHATRKVNDLAAYLCEYMVKKPKLTEGFKGRIWSCNYDISHSNSCKLNIDPTEMSECVKSLSHKAIRYAALEAPPDAMGTRKKIGEIFFINTDCWSRIIKGRIKERYDEHRFYIRNGTATPPLSYYEVEYFSEKNVSEFVERNNKPKTIKPCTSTHLKPTKQQLKSLQQTLPLQ
jgi:hypothetical protein